MGLKGKVVSQISIKCKGNVFHLFKFPNLFSKVTPQLVQRVDLLEGHWGTPGSVICWYYTQDGTKKVSKEMIEGIDENKRRITSNAIEGALLMDSFKAFKIIVEVATNGEDNIITWTMEYVKKSEDVPVPFECMNFAIYSQNKLNAITINSSPINTIHIIWNYDL